MIEIFESTSGMFEIHIIWVLLWFVMMLWSITWKGFALWIAVKEQKKAWFVALLIVNTAGLLEIIYIFFFSKAGKKFIKDFKTKKKENIEEIKKTEEKEEKEEN